MSLAPRTPPTTDVQHYEHDAMNCTFGVALVGVAARYAAQAAQAVFDELDRLEQVLSRFIPHSDIAQIAALEPGRSLRVAIETIECLRLAAQLYDLTGGAFDIAYRAPRSRDLPPLVLDPAAHAVGVQLAGVQLDLGGIGKGYAVDRMVDVLQQWGIAAGCVHAGQSTVRVFGELPDGWPVGLRDPRQPELCVETLVLRDAALSGSGRRLHGAHIIDPRSGHPAVGAEAAWAVAPSAALADGLSTAFMVLGPAEVAAVCDRRRDVTALLIPADNEQPLLRFGAGGDCADREAR